MLRAEESPAARADAAECSFEQPTALVARWLERGAPESRHAIDRSKLVIVQPDRLIGTLLAFGICSG